LAGFVSIEDAIMAPMRNVLVALGLTFSGLAQQPDPLIWGGLELGPHAIGYRSHFEFDSKRPYGPSRGPRPILVNVWYPAKATSSEPMRYRDYITIPPLPRYPHFGPKLEAHLLDAISEGLFRKRRRDLNEDERVFLDDFATWSGYLPCRAEAAIRYFSHNDFLLHGSISRAFSHDNAVEVRRNYDHLARTLCAFLDAHLRGNPVGWRRLVAENRVEFQIKDWASSHPDECR
jgi:hypothetical protein